MGRLTAELITLSPQFTNTLKDRELDLRGNKIAAIENLGGTLDQFDTIDLSDNEVKVVDGFPLLKRLRTLLLNNNQVAKFAEGLETSLPHLEEIILTNNELTQLGDLNPLASLKELKRLSLLQNAVTNLAYYRLYLIHLLPNLNILDFNKVKDKEREEAKKLFAGAAGKKLKAEIVKTSAAPVTASAVVAAAAAGGGPTGASGPSPQEILRIKAAIQKATSLQEVRDLEAQLKAGTWKENGHMDTS